MVSELLAGTVPGQRRKWTAGSINPMLNIISAVMSDLVKQGTLVRDVAALVDRVERSKTKLATFTEPEVRTLLRHVPVTASVTPGTWPSQGCAAGSCAGCGGRRRPGGGHGDHRAQPGVGERAANGQPAEDGQLGPALPLTPALTAALRRAQATQKTERLALGPDYGAGEHVVCDEAGRPYHPDTISDYWRALCIEAGVPSIRLHDARHTCGRSCTCRACRSR